jgi:hypothetical protein
MPEKSLTRLARLSAMPSMIPIIVGDAPITEDKYNGRMG